MILIEGRIFSFNHSKDTWIQRPLVIVCDDTLKHAGRAPEDTDRTSD